MGQARWQQKHVFLVNGVLARHSEGVGTGGLGSKEPRKMAVRQEIYVALNFGPLGVCILDHPHYTSICKYARVTLHTMSI